MKIRSVLIRTSTICVSEEKQLFGQRPMVKVVFRCELFRANLLFLWFSLNVNFTRAWNITFERKTFRRCPQGASLCISRGLIFTQNFKNWLKIALENSKRVLLSIPHRGKRNFSKVGRRPKKCLKNRKMKILGQKFFGLAQQVCAMLPTCFSC